MTTWGWKDHKGVGTRNFIPEWPFSWLKERADGRWSQMPHPSNVELCSLDIPLNVFKIKTHLPHPHSPAMLQFGLIFRCKWKESPNHKCTSSTDDLAQLTRESQYSSYSFLCTVNGKAQSIQNFQQYYESGFIARESFPLNPRSLVGRFSCKRHDTNQSRSLFLQSFGLFPIDLSHFIQHHFQQERQRPAYEERAWGGWNARG